MRHYISFNNVRLFSYVFTTEYPQSEWLKHDESIFSDFEILTGIPKTDPPPAQLQNVGPLWWDLLCAIYPSKFVLCAYYNYTNL